MKQRVRRHRLPTRTKVPWSSARVAILDFQKNVDLMRYKFEEAFLKPVMLQVVKAFGIPPDLLTGRMVEGQPEQVRWISVNCPGALVHSPADIVSMLKPSALGKSEEIIPNPESKT